MLPSETDGSSLNKLCPLSPGPQCRAQNTFGRQEHELPFIILPNTNNHGLSRNGLPRHIAIFHIFCPKLNPCGPTGSNYLLCLVSCRG